MAKDRAKDGNNGRHGPLRLVSRGIAPGRRQLIASTDTQRRRGLLAAGHLARRPVPHAPTLAGLAVLEPRAPAGQQRVLDGLGLAGDEFAERIFARSGVSERALNLEEDFLAASLEERTAQVEQELLDRSVDVVDRLEIDTGRVGTLITSSLYSLGCPSLAHRLIEHYALDPSTDKYHVTAVGCASAVPLLRLGGQVLHSDPSRDVLVVAAESMSSLQAPGESSRVRTVGSAIFGDGCAAAVLSARPAAQGPAILASVVHQIPGTLEAVELRCDDQGSHLGLARELPAIAGDGLAGLTAAFLAANHVEERQITHWMLHPGGRRIVEESRDALGLDDEDVAISWRALAAHGNVGTPSIFYVLDMTIRERRPEPGELGLAVTIGPGVSVGLMLVEF